VKRTQVARFCVLDFVQLDTRNTLKSRRFCWNIALRKYVGSDTLGGCSEAMSGGRFFQFGIQIEQIANAVLVQT
jgi:hypothetical protein